MQYVNMKRHGRIILLLGTLIVAASVASAQTGGGYDLSWSTVDNDGGECSGGGYTLTGMAGQPDAGVLSGGDYTLQGGFQRCAVLHDVDDNGVVNMADVQYVAGQWHEPSPGIADRNGDDQANIVDVMMVATDWGESCEQAR